MSGRLRYTAHVLDRGLDLFAAFESQQLGGMVAKPVDSLYVSGRQRLVEGLVSRRSRSELRAGVIGDLVPDILYSRTRAAQG